MRKKSQKSGAEDQLRKKVATSLADARKSVPASKVFKRLRAIHSAATRTPSSPRNGLSRCAGMTLEYLCTNKKGRLLKPTPYSSR